jgi:SAM-dependent methyltransferase
MVLAIDVSPELIEALRKFGEGFENVEFLRADVTMDSPPDCYSGQMDIVYSIDTLNYISPPDAMFAFVEKLLKPGGRAFVSFPNEKDSVMEGKTNFKKFNELVQSVVESGLLCESIYVARFTRWHNFVYMNFWYRIKQALHRTHYRKRAKPQVFNETVAFRMVRAEKRRNIFIRLYTVLVMTLLRLGGVYKYINTREIYGKYIILLLRKPLQTS